jgi:hypothetical protein
MKYACLVYHEERDLDIPQDELRDRMRSCGAWVSDLERGGQHVVCAALQSAGTATTLRSRNGKISVTDGPFAETKEVLAGFTLIEARDLNEALRQASKLAACSRGSIEVRPLMQPGVEMANERDRRIQAALTDATSEIR